jgi:predicted dehydrogenase
VPDAVAGRHATGNGVTGNGVPDISDFTHASAKHAVGWPDFEPLRVAVIGLGYWGPHLVRNFVELSAADVVAVCDVEAEPLAAISRRFPSVYGTRDLDEILDDSSIEAVAIATPVSTHHALASAALRAGKHVFVEKPLAASSADAVELIELARDRGLVLMPGHTFLFSPPVNMIRDLIRAGELGEIYFVTTSRVNLGLHQADVSVTWDLGPHDFSILLYWLDARPTYVSALSRGFVFSHVPDVAFINLEFESGAVAHVELSWLAPSKLRRTAIVGSERMVVYDDTSIEPVRVFDAGVTVPNPETFGEFRLTYRTGSIVSPRVDVTEPLAIELAEFCTAVRGRTEVRSTPELGLAVIDIIEAVDRSLANRGERVLVERSVSPNGDSARLAAEGSGTSV